MTKKHGYSKIVNYAIALFMFVSIGRLHEVTPVLMGVQVGKITLLLALLSSLTIANEFKTLNYNKSITKIFILFTLLAYLSVFFSVWKSQSLLMLQGPMISLVILFFLISKSIQTTQHVKFYINILILNAAILAFATISLNASGRLSVGESYDPNDLAMVLVTIIPFVIVAINDASSWRKIVFILTFGISIYAIMLTGSRGGFLGLMSVGIYFAFTKLPKVNKPNTSRFSFKKILILIVLSIILVNFLPESYWDRISTIFSPEQDYNLTSSRGRIAIWTEGIQMMLEHPQGVGITAFSAAQGMLYGGYYQTAHNTLILVGAELGIIGLILFLSFYYAALSSLKLIGHGKAQACDELLQSSIAVKGALIGFFVTSFFLSQAYSALFFTLLAIAQGMNKVCQQSIVEKEDSE